MKTHLQIIRILNVIFFTATSIVVFSQNKSNAFDAGGYTYSQNNEKNPCISAEEYVRINNEVKANLKKLGLEKRPFSSPLTTSFIWPLRLASGFSQCEYHFIGAYVDQNTATTAVQDYNCESNTYDGHQGTDIAIWPYGFYKMDHNQIEVIAAAAGTIVQRADGNFDRNCASNTLTANSIIIQHADGSYAYYWHMKNGSVTPKIVGQTVAVGEYLGVVGSSGSSTGPHLHFEVRTSTAITSYKDPFAGNCNLLNTNSWWISQKPHTNPAVLKVSVNTTDLVSPACPTTETPNESNSFTIPFQGPGLAPGYAKFYLFLREATVGTTVDLKILNPNGSTFTSWTYSVNTFYKVSYWGWSKLLPTISGTYTFQATYNGITCATNFDIINPLGLQNTAELTQLKLFPNPTNTSFTLVSDQMENGKYHYTMTSVSGQILKTDTFEIDANEIQKEISIAELPAGIYFLTLENTHSRAVKKIIKQ
jgi:murein DD-endopeptidase MepM/ murein hydrolase activator NlpD